MAKHISDKDVKTVKGILDGWQGKLTWDLLVDALESRSGFRTTRQALSRNESIKEAFKDRKKELSDGTINRSRPQSLKLATDRIWRQQVEIERLTRENERLLEQFRVWQYNAHKYGLSEDKLNEAMPKVDKRS